MGVQKHATKRLAISLLTCDRFLNFFQGHTPRKICDKTVVINYDIIDM